MSRNARSAGQSWGPSIGRWLRDRHLAGDGKAGEFARNKARREQRSYVRRNWRRMSAAALILAVPVAIAAYLASNVFYRGLLVGAGVATISAVLVIDVLQATGTTSVMMGATAEQWTASELRKLRRDGWRMVNGVRLQNWDIDHVLIGPGGVFAVETKWSAHPWELSPIGDRVLDAVGQVRRNTRNLAFWHDFKSAGVDVVHPVVMLWGLGLASRPPEETLQRVDGVWIVAGPSAHR